MKAGRVLPKAALVCPPTINLKHACTRHTGHTLSGTDFVKNQNCKGWCCLLGSFYRCPFLHVCALDPCCHDQSDTRQVHLPHAALDTVRVHWMQGTFCICSLDVQWPIMCTYVGASLRLQRASCHACSPCLPRCFFGMWGKLASYAL